MPGTRPGAHPPAVAFGEGRATRRFSALFFLALVFVFGLGWPAYGGLRGAAQPPDSLIPATAPAGAPPAWKAPARHAQPPATAEDSAKRLLNVAPADPNLCQKPLRAGHVEDGGWWVCLDGVTPGDCLVYSAGTRDDASFDEAMAAHGCEVHAFDPSLGQMAGLGFATAAAREGLAKSPVTFHPFGLSSQDMVYPPGTAPWAWPGMGYGRDANTEPWTMRNLESARRDLGHAGRTIDIFKMDIEGAEWPVLERLLSDGAARTALQSGTLFRQLVTEVHFMPRPPSGNVVPPAYIGNPGRHPAAADVDAANAHAADLLAQLQALGLRSWNHDINVGGPRVVDGDFSCCHEVSFMMAGRPMP